MAVTDFDPASTMLEARARYFEVNHFGANGGYDEPWVDFKLGPIPMPFPNTAARISAVKVHDLHHIVTGYATDTAGELEIAGFEIGAGCGRFVAAWVINLAGMGVGALLWPRRVFRAFVRGRRSRSLYGESLDALLVRSVADVRAECGVDAASSAPATATETVAFVATAVFGLAVAVVFFALTAPLMPLGVLALSLARRRAGG